MDTLYTDRKLARGYPGLGRKSFETFTGRIDAHGGEENSTGVERQMRYLDRLIAGGLRDVVVVGCGPRPHMVRLLLERGYRAVGIEPVPSYVAAGREFLGAEDAVLEGSAEHMPLDDASQDLVYCNSVMEHVDSPLQSLAEMQRVLRPGGAAFIITTNRYGVSLRGSMMEFSVPLYNWLPDVVKESYVFHHLHYDPRLANHSQRPAVHWYSYSGLCALGRTAGFAQFYSPIDLMRSDDPQIAAKPARRLLLPRVQRSPWLRSLALTFTHFGGMIVMLKGHGADIDTAALQGELPDGHERTLAERFS